MSTPHPSPPPGIDDLLDRSFGDGPPAVAATARVQAGRRALRRRRTLAGAGAATAVATLTVAVALMSGGSQGTTTEIAPAEQPSAGVPTDDEEHSYEAGSSKDTRPRPSGRSAVELYPGGVLAKARNVTVTERIDNPLGYRAPDASLGIAYERDGESTWALLTYQEDPDGTSTTGTSSDPANKSFATLQQWIDDQVALQNGDEPPQQLVLFADDGTETLLPREGVEILQQSADLDLGAGFAGPGDASAVAEVRFAGERYYVLARALADSAPQYLPTAAEVGGPTLEDFLDYAGQQYAEGGGGLR